MTELELLARELQRAARAAEPQPPDLVQAAAAEGLLDVSYAELDSPLGKLLLAATPAGLVRVAYLDHAPEQAVLEEVAARVSPRVLSAPRRLDRARRELDEYFRGRRHNFELEVDWQLTRGFARRVLEATAAIPYGSVLTYTDVAVLAGSPRASRAAGNALGANPLPIVIPCHRIVRSGGGLGGYTGGVDRKRTLLAIEQGQSPLAAG